MNCFFGFVLKCKRKKHTIHRLHFDSGIFCLPFSRKCNILFVDPSWWVPKCRVRPHWEQAGRMKWTTYAQCFWYYTYKWQWVQCSLFAHYYYYYCFFEYFHVCFFCVARCVFFLLLFRYFAGSLQRDGVCLYIENWANVSDDFVVALWVNEL